MTAAALLIMPSLALAKHRTGTAALLGVGLNAWLGWWWADPAAALVIAGLAVKEGLEVWEDDEP